MDDEELFRQQFADVKPLKKTGRVQLEKNHQFDGKQTERARENAVGNSRALYQNPDSMSPGFDTVSDDYIERLSPHDPVSFKRSGIQNAVFKKLRLGKYPVEGRLDLHQKKVAQAKKEVYQLIAKGMQYDMRCLLIVHGKGDRGSGEQATLKSYVAKWLQEIPDVMAYHSAIQQHGGVGAVYVMLRKSEKAREATREKLGRRE